MITLFHTIILAIVEGITEFLPISSTAHLILTARLFNLPQTEFLKTFEIAIQSGAILAVIVLYGKKFLDIEIGKRLIIAFLPTGILGLLFYSFIKNHLLESVPIVLTALGIGGIVLILFEIFRMKRGFSPKLDLPLRAIPIPHALLLGFFQAIAMIPGVSRSAATIIGGLSLGIPRRTIVEFSFLNISIYEQHLEIVEFLLKNGADPEIVYASLGDFNCALDRRNCSLPGGGVYVSGDAGLSWRRVTDSTWRV